MEMFGQDTYHLMLALGLKVDNKGVREANKVMKQLEKSATTVTRFNTRMGKIEKKYQADREVITKAYLSQERAKTNASKRFRAEWLSVIFIGQQLSRVFGDVRKTGQEWLSGLTAVSDAYKGLITLGAEQTFQEWVNNFWKGIYNLKKKIQESTGIDIGWAVLAAQWASSAAMAFAEGWIMYTGFAAAGKFSGAALGTGLKQGFLSVLGVTAAQGVGAAAIGGAGAAVATGIVGGAIFAESIVDALMDSLGIGEAWKKYKSLAGGGITAVEASENTFNRGTTAQDIYDSASYQNAMYNARSGVEGVSSGGRYINQSVTVNVNQTGMMTSGNAYNVGQGVGSALLDTYNRLTNRPSIGW